MLLLGIDLDSPEEVMDRLGMPLGSPWARIGTFEPISESEAETVIAIKAAESAGLTYDNMTTPTTALAGWGGFSFDMFGRIVPAIRTAFPHWRFDGDPDLILEVWYARVFTPDAQSEVQGIWSPRLGVCKGITAAGVRWNGRSLKRAVAAIELLEAFELAGTTGRPDGTKHYRAGDDKIFAEDVKRAVRACIEDGDRVNNSMVSKRMGCHRDTLAGYLVDFPSVRLKTIETKILAETVLPAKTSSLRVTRKRNPRTV